MTFPTEPPAAQLFGVSVTGPTHRKEGRSCEDAWRGWNSGQGAAIVVADGLGSRSQSAHGARMATRAGIAAYRSWSKAPKVSGDWLVRSCEVNWRFAVAPRDPGDCATTCLIAGWAPETGLTIAALGDGMILLRSGGKPVECLHSRLDSEALNETQALGEPHRLIDWTLHQKDVEKPWAVALMTDGISDDLRTDRLDRFLSWLTDEVASMDPPRRRLTLRKALTDWPTANHTDDKTVAVLFSHA